MIVAFGPPSESESPMLHGTDVPMELSKSADPGMWTCFLAYTADRFALQARGLTAIAQAVALDLLADSLTEKLKDGHTSHLKQKPPSESAMTS